MEFLYGLDTTVFFFVNHLGHNIVSDGAAKFLSGVGTAGIIWFVFGVVLFLLEEKKDHWFVLQLFVSAGAAGLVTSVLKHVVARYRPSPEMGAIIVSAARDLYSFPSGHATLAFAGAVVLSAKEPRFQWFFYTLAFLIAFSRIYLGVHYPLDVVAGGILGFGIGRLTETVLVQVIRPTSHRLVS